MSIITSRRELRQAEEARAAKLAEITEQLVAETGQNEWLAERLAELELALDEQGWARLSMETEWEFSREGLDRIIALARLNSLKNPLIRRGVAVKADYVHGQGVDIVARDETVNDEVVQPFLDDRGNAAELFAASARAAKDRALTTDGNVVLVLFPNRLTGRVSVRSVDVGEIRDVIVNPDDRQDVWFYLRRWTERSWQLDGPASGIRTAQREAWYPDWRHQPKAGQRPESIDRVQVRWDSPIYHVRVGGLDGMRFGVPEVYAALDWAKAYKLFLEDWATIVRSLSRFAWQMHVKKNPSTAAARLGASVRPEAARVPDNPSPTAGAVFTARADTDLKPIPKTDATVASEDGVWLAKMCAAALGLPYTILMGDPDMGNLATAKTLDRPTELGMMGRQTIWAEVYRDLCGYAIDWAARAPGGPLTGEVEIRDGVAVVVLDDAGELTGAERRTVDVTFPAIREIDLAETMKAIVEAASTDIPEPKMLMRWIFQAMGVDDIDEALVEWETEHEERKQRERNVGDEMIRRQRSGQDPFPDDE